MVWQQSHDSEPRKKPPSLKFQNSKKAHIGGALAQSSSPKKLLGIQTDSERSFDKHISSICNKVAAKINVRSRLVNYVIW